MYKKTSYIIILLFLMTFTGQCSKEKPVRSTVSYLQELSALKKNKGNREIADNLIKQGLELHKKKNYSGAIDLWYQAAKADPSWWTPYFDIACAEALRGNKDLSLKFLSLALTVNQSEELIKSIKNDKDLSSIRDTEDYRDIINRFDINNLLPGAWADSSDDDIKMLPGKFKDYRPAEYIKIIFHDKGNISINETSSRKTGTYSLQGKILLIKLTGAETEERHVNGKIEGGKNSINIEEKAEVTYISGTLLCLEWAKGNEAERICYSKSTP